MGPWNTARSDPGCVWHLSNHSCFHWISLWYVPFWDEVGCCEHEAHQESHRSEALIEGKATATPMMRRTPPSKVIFSLEIKLFREETNELRICTHYSEAELWSVAWLPVGQSALGTIIRVSWSPSAAFCQLCAHVRALLQTNAACPACPPSRCSVAKPPEGVMAAPSGRALLWAALIAPHQMRKEKSCCEDGSNKAGEDGVITVKPI